MVRLPALVIVTCCLMACSPQAELVERAAEDSGATFNAAAIIAVSDLDMAGTGYADRKLRQLVGQSDALSIVSALDTATPRTVSTRVSNSVTGWPGPIALSADNRFAYVIETQGEIDDGIVKADNVYTGSPGSWLTTLDITDLQAPRVVARTRIGANPTAVTLIAGGNALVISRRDDRAPLAIVTLADGLPTATKLVGFPIAIKGPRASDKGVPYVSANADGTMLALNLAFTHIGFARIVRDPAGSVTSIIPFGEPVEAGKWLSMGKWSPDGRHFIVTDTGWGPGQFDAVLNSAGALVSIAVGADGKHRIASRLATSLSPEGMDFSVDGKHIAVANMERTYLPEGLPFALFSGRERYSLSLVGFDNNSGKLAMLDGPVAFEGVLPEDVVFDDAGTMLAVAVFHERSEAPKAGWVELVGINGSRIVPTGKRITLPRGVHDLAVIRRPAPVPSAPQN